MSNEDVRKHTLSSKEKDGVMAYVIKKYGTAGTPFNPLNMWRDVEDYYSLLLGKRDKKARTNQINACYESYKKYGMEVSNGNCNAI